MSRVARTTQRLASTLVGFLFFTVTALSAWGGDADYTVRINDATGETETAGDVIISLDVTADDVYGWSVAVCHDSDLVTLEEVLDGADLAVANDGDAPEFAQVTLYDDGFVAGALVCLTSCEFLPTGAEYELYLASYTPLALAPTVIDLTLCDTLPAIDNEVVLLGGVSIDPTLDDGTLTVTGPPPRYFELSTDAGIVPYDPSDGLAAVDITVSMTEDETNPTFPNPVEAFQFTIDFDPIIVELLTADAGTDLAATNGGLGPDILTIDLLTDSVSYDVLVSAAPIDGLLTDGGASVGALAFDVNSTALQFNPFGIDTTLTFAEGHNATITGSFVGTTAVDGTIEFTPQQKLIRGDANDDGAVDFVDALLILEVLFEEGDSPLCPETFDVTANGSTNIADAVALLAYVFLGGAPPEAPFPDCGFAAVGSSCPLYSSCP